jgi:hypothetical protein
LGVQHPVQFVRAGYRKHAVETKKQEIYIEDLDVSELKWTVRMASWVSYVTRLFI